MNYHSNILILFMLVLLLLFLSCSHEPLLSPDSPEVCFQDQVLPLINSNCALPGCHNAGSGGEESPLTTYDQIIKFVEAGKPNKSKLYNVVTSTSLLEEKMPPKPATRLNYRQVSLISLWILEGANNNTCPEPPCDTVNVTFSASISPVIDTYCKGCHSGGNPSGGISLETYDQIAALAQNGKLYGSVSHQQGYVAMPNNSPMLSGCIITMFRIWAENGAPVN
jgi:hypothetical protein